MERVIAFIPVRGGSKSIPLKNIKDFCGNPLVYWILKELQSVNAIDRIIVATDSDQIESVVKYFGFSKVIVYRRSVENASDGASTESVMLEYIQYAKLPINDVFMLVQATSPLTEEKHFCEALELYRSEAFDSILTCVRNYRFFWNAEGTSKNYDYRNRPRRQAFNGELMENGAFYINTVGNILKFQNRLCGKIGIYIMPEYTAFEIDEPDDWGILENLMRTHVLNKRKAERQKIKLFLSDVDGVLTDGSMYYSEKGDELKKFNTRDGMAFQLLREAGIKTGLITSENTEIVAKRATKLKIDYVYQGKYRGGKLQVAKDICEKEHISMSEVAYIGDDINCLDILSEVGFAACPSNAMGRVKEIDSILVLNSKGGEGAVREFVEIILSDTNC